MGQRSLALPSPLSYLTADSPFFCEDKFVAAGRIGGARAGGRCRDNYQRRFFVRLIATLNYREKYREAPAGKLKWLFLDLSFFRIFYLPARSPPIVALIPPVFFSPRSPPPPCLVVPLICLNNTLIAARAPWESAPKAFAFRDPSRSHPPCLSNCRGLIYCKLKGVSFLWDCLS